MHLHQQIGRFFVVIACSVVTFSGASAFGVEFTYDANDLHVAEDAAQEYSRTSDQLQRAKLARIITSFSRLTELVELAKSSSDRSLSLLGEWWLAIREMEADAILAARHFERGEPYENRTPQILQEFFKIASKKLDVSFPEPVLNYLCERDFRTDEYVIRKSEIFAGRNLQSELMDEVGLTRMHDGKVTTFSVPNDVGPWAVDCDIAIGRVDGFVLAGDTLLLVVPSQGANSITRPDCVVLCVKRGEKKPLWVQPCSAYVVEQVTSGSPPISLPLVSNTKKSAIVLFMHVGGFSLTSFDMTTGCQQVTFHSRIPYFEFYEWTRPLD